MAEQQIIKIQQLQIAESNQSSKKNVRLISQEIFEDDPKIQDMKIAKENRQEVNPQKLHEKSFTIRFTKTNKQNQAKLPRVNSQKKISKKKDLNEQRFINKNRKSSSVKKLDKSKSFKRQEIQRDKIKNPVKYKIVQQLFSCKPQVIYNMNKSQNQFIQQKNMKIKGQKYLRQALSKIKMRRQKINTQASSLPKKIKPSKVDYTRLVQIQKIKKKKVLKKVKNHFQKANSNIFVHIDSSASVDKAFVSFLKTKIQKVELIFKN